MGIFKPGDGWVVILLFLGAANASIQLRNLIKARRHGTPFDEIPPSVWSGLCVGLAFLGDGVLRLRYPDGTWLSWFLTPLLLAGLTALAAPGIAARRQAGLPWWRFWTRVLPTPSAAEVTGFGAADSLAPSAAHPLDDRSLDLIERIKNAKFDTTRLSSGYDEEEVDNFLDKVIAVLSDGGQPDQEDLRTVKFDTTWLRPGYARPDVDHLLQEIAQVALP